MKRGIVIALLTILTSLSAGASVWMWAGDNDVVIEGIVIDTKCYAQDSKNWVNDHDTPNGKIAQCGTACAAMGIPVGILEGGKEGGEVHVLLIPSRSLSQYIGKWARVSGKHAFKGSFVVNSVEVKEKNGEYKKVEIVTMM